MSKVFVISENIKERFNIDGLSTLGDVTYLYPANQRTPSVYNPTQFCQSIAARLEAAKFCVGKDCLAMVGKQIEICLLFYVAGLLVNGNIDIAFYDSKDACFVRKSIDQNAIPNLQVSQ